ncbi:MAG: envelope stress response membrane protein PspC [Proteobacteria bacterium]|nr:envelope stress response membrane protein PspC [Pseudomonadota bacterium]
MRSRRRHSESGNRGGTGSSYSTSAKSGLYRSRDGAILGVCKGLSRYLDIEVLWVRLIAVAVLLFSGFWPAIGLYFLAALLIKPEPVLPFRGAEDVEFYNSFTASRSMALGRLKRTYDNLDRRLGRMEDHVTAREYDWERRFNQG